MPPLEKMDRKDKAVLWAATGHDRLGQFVFDAPVQLDPAFRTGVRWSGKRVEAVDAQGNKVSLDATAIVDRAIPIGSLMWEGDIADLIATLSDQGDSELMEVKMFDDTYDIKHRARNVRREVGMMRYRNKPPDFLNYLLTSSRNVVVTSTGELVLAS